MALTGIYNSAGTNSNDLDVVVKDSAKLVGKLDNTLEVAKIDTLYDQKVNINIASEANIVPNSIKVYDHDELTTLATEAGRTLAAKKTNTDLTITVNSETVYPTE